MIRYSLTCQDGHSFESWFQSSDAYDALAARGLISCTSCGSTEVKKALMAPRVSATEVEAETAPADQRQAMAAGPLSQPGSKMERMLADLRKTVEENSTYVGGNFATEARQMHLGEVPERQIHGEATPQEARDLVEDGVPILPLPVLPKSKAN